MSRVFSFILIEVIINALGGNMDSSDKFWAFLWTLFAIVLLVGFTTLRGCAADEHTAVQAMINKGATPMEAKCAFMSQQTRSADVVCVTLAFQHKKEETK